MPLNASPNHWLVVAAFNGAIAVAAGAFAAHGLKGALTPSMLEVFKTGAQYQLMHALALGLAAQISGRKAQIACGLFLAGIILFCGSLYALALSGIRIIGIITPLGGVSFLAGWLVLAWAGLRRS